MAQHSVSISSVVFEKLNKARMEIALHGERHFSITMLMDYLLEFNQIIRDEYMTIKKLPVGREAYEALLMMLSKAMSYQPTRYRRKEQLPVGATSMVNRLLAQQQLIDLGVSENPTTEEVNWWLENRSNQVMRNLMDAKNKASKDSYEKEKAIEKLPPQADAEGEPFPI